LSVSGTAEYQALSLEKMIADSFIRFKGKVHRQLPEGGAPIKTGPQRVSGSSQLNPLHS
jgi:hypothetical protein